VDPLSPPPSPNARCDLGHRSAMRGGSRLRLAGRVRRAHAKVVRSGAEPGGGLLPGSKVGPARCRSVATPVPPKAIAATPVRSSPCFSKRLRRAREDPAFTNSYSRSCLSPSTFSKTAQRRRRRRRRSVQPGGNRAEAAPVSGIVQLTCEYIITPLHFQERGFGIIASDNSPLQSGGRGRRDLCSFPVGCAARGA
jgi:hypothetical protein